MSQKVIIVTAASKGIGKACATKLSGQGYFLSLMSRSEEIHQLAREGEIITAQGDVTNSKHLESLVQATFDKFGRIDGVVNNTGHPPKGELIDISDEEWLQGFELTFLNIVRMTRLITPIFQKQRSGSIVNLSTFAAKEPDLKFPVSSVIRSSLGNFAKLFADRYGKDNLRMNNVLPGFVESYPVPEEIIETIPMSRQAKTVEIANLVSFLISDDSSYINGQSILIDGGLTKSI